MKRFPWLTLVMLALPSYALALLLWMWWVARANPGWVFTWQTWASWEPCFDAVVLHAGGLFILWRWWVLAKALWGRYGP